MDRSTYSLGYETHRFWWKAKPENKGKLHTSGLAAYCIHPNYFGDLFTYTGWAIVSGTMCNLQIVLWQPAVFFYLVMPNSDAYLAQRYSKEWPSYAEKTARLIPFVSNKYAEGAIAVVTCAACLYCGSQCTNHCGA